MTNQPKTIVEDGYDQVAEAYSRLEGDQQWPRMKWLQKVLDRLGPGNKVLDLGCGSGDPADIEIARQHDVTGVDISRAQVEMARQNVPLGRFIHGDLATLEFPEGSFDAVVSFYTLEHLPREHHGEILNRIHGWLRPGGLLLFSYEAEAMNDVTGQWLGVSMFISSFDPETIKGLVLKAGFEVLETEIESQMEQNREVDYLWTLAVKT